MNTAVATQSDKGSIMESVLVKGDLGKLTPEERSIYYMKVCESVGINPLTKPFDYITLNGKMVLYALRTCTDQLRSVHKISVEEMTETEREGVFIVTAKVCNGQGRTDIAKGAVNISGLKGEALANALMKAETKAKRRATLSICGLGLLDETEVETIPNAARVDGSTGEIIENKANGYHPTDPLRPYKDDYVITVPVNIEGNLNLDAFAADLESRIDSAKNGNELSLLNRANAKTLRVMEKERPDLFQNIGDTFRKMSQALM